MIYLIEPPPSLAPILANFAPAMGSDDAEHTLTRGDAIRKLRAALVANRPPRTPGDSAHLAAALSRLLFEQFTLEGIEDASQTLQQAVQLARMAGDDALQVASLANLCLVQYYLGNCEGALVAADAGLEIPTPPGQEAQAGYLHTLRGAVYSYLGHYEAAEAAFETARDCFLTQGDPLGIAWYQHIYARELLRDQNRLKLAAEYLEVSLPILKEQATAQAALENMLAGADCAIQQHFLDRAVDLLDDAESIMYSGKRPWSHPELYLVRARLSLAQGDPKRAYQYAQRGLGAVGAHGGDIRTLPLLYCAMAAALDRDRSRLNDARDALARAVTAARARGRRLHLAQALRQSGHLLKRFTTMPTLRARGSGFLFEADRTLMEMGLPTAPTPAEA
jgi:tetratricopeptide (TPR) repeat protein